MSARKNNLASSQLDLLITRVFDAPRELVYGAWIDPACAIKWWGPTDFPATHLEMDVRPGGRWRGCLRSTEDGRELWQHGVFHDIAAPERIVFSFRWEEQGERGQETLVTVNFDECDGRTHMTLRQTPFQSISERNGHEYGWNSTFDRLVEHLHIEKSK